MGQSLTRSSSSVDVCAALRGLGEVYEVYCNKVSSIGIDGDFLLSLKSEQEVLDFLVDEVTNRTHARKLKTEILKLIEASSIAPGAAKRGSADSTLSPESLMPLRQSISSRIDLTEVPTQEGTDCFLTHNWGLSPDFENHCRVSHLNNFIEGRGIVTWFDSKRMTGSVHDVMAAGIENTKCVVVFITQLYHDKVNADDLRDNCKFEFCHAMRKLGPQRMVPVVMEAGMKNNRNWNGVLGASLAGLMYIDMSDVVVGTPAFEAKACEIADRVISIIRDRPPSMRLSKTPPSHLLEPVKDEASALPPASSKTTPSSTLPVGPRRPPSSSSSDPVIVRQTELAKARPHKAPPPPPPPSPPPTTERRASDVATPPPRPPPQQPSPQPTFPASSTGLSKRPGGSGSVTTASGGQGSYPARHPGPKAHIDAPKGIGRRLWDAAEKGDVVHLELLLDEWAGNEAVLNCQHVSDFSPFTIACYKRNFDCVRALASTSGVDVNLGFNAGKLTALFHAAASGHSDLVKLLLAVEGLEIDKAPIGGDSKDKTPLKIAREKATKTNGCKEVSALLLAAGATEKVPLPTRRRNPGRKAQVDAPEGTGLRLYESAKEGNLSELSLLLDEWRGNESVLNWRLPGRGSSPLTISCVHDHVECVRALVNASGVDVNRGDDFGWTGLFYAAHNGNVKVVAVLLKVEGLEIDKAPTSEGCKDKTPLDIASENAAASYRPGCAVVARMLERKRNVALGKVPSRAPALHRSPGPKAHIDAPKGIGRRLWDAAEKGDVVHLELLLDEWAGNEAVLNWRNQDDGCHGQSPIHVAGLWGHVECVRALVNTSGVDVNLGTNSAYTVLWGAVNTGKLEVVVELLTAEDIDTDIAPTCSSDGDEGIGSYKGKTPLKIALSRASEGAEAYREGCKEIANLLEEAGATVR